MSVNRARARRRRQKARRKEKIREAVELVREWGKRNRGEYDVTIDMETIGGDPFASVLKNVESAISKTMTEMGKAVQGIGVALDNMGNVVANVKWTEPEPLGSITFTLKAEGDDDARDG